MFYPKITIVTPNYNGSRYLEDTIMSVFGQNYPNLEYIIIDGGSTDGSINIIKKYENRLAYWVSEPDNGMYHAIQKGFEKSTGELMAWINSDDMYHKNAFFTIAEIFDTFDEVNWLVGASTFYDEENRTVHCNQSRLFTKFDFYNYDFKWLEQESVFWRRSLWNISGATLNTKLKYAGDFDLWLKLFKYEKLYVTHALIGGFRWRSSKQLSTEHFEEYLVEANDAIKQVMLSYEDQRILNNYKLILKIKSILDYFLFFNTDWIEQRFRNRYFPKPTWIAFDRHKMKFMLSS